MGIGFTRAATAGGLDKVKAACKELEAKMGNNEADQPGFMAAARPVTFRAYKIANEWFGDGKRVSDLESYFQENDKRLFVERVQPGRSHRKRG